MGRAADTLAESPGRYPGTATTWKQTCMEFNWTKLGVDLGKE